MSKKRTTPCPVCGEGDYEGWSVQFDGDPKRSSQPWGSSGVRISISAHLDPDRDDELIYTVKCSARDTPHTRDEVSDELREILRAMYKRLSQKPESGNGSAALDKLPKAED